MSTTRLYAIATTVSDLDRSREFYTQALGFSPVSDIIIEDESFCKLAQLPPTRVRLATLKLGDEHIELMQYLDIAPQSIPEDSKSNDLWFQHMAIVVRDMSQAYGRLQAFPIQSISTQPQTIPEDNPMAGGVQAFKFRDIDRHSLELIWFPPDKGSARWQQPGEALFLGIDHTAITVSSTDASIAFYRDLLGMTVAGGNLNSGEVQAQLDGLPVAEVQVTPLQPAETGAGMELLDYIKPGTGRSVPDHWRASDLPHRHTVLAVDSPEEILDKLRQRGAVVVSPQPIDLPEAYRYSRGSLVNDPDGHSLLIVSP
ncbi:MAG: VOC family protein [Elainellaceae cyanobacterium]